MADPARAELLPRRILLLLPAAFGALGGIQAYNRLVVRAAGSLTAARRGCCEALILNDAPGSEDARYLTGDAVSARGFGRSKVRFVREALRRARGLKPEVIVVGHVNLLPLAAALRWARPQAAQVVLTHGIDAWRRLPWLSRRALLRAERILSVSRYTAAELARRNGVDATRVKLQLNVVDPLWAAEFGAGAPPPLPERPALLSVSRLDRQDRYKGIDSVLACLPDVARAIPQISYEIVGDGDDRPRLEAIARERGVMDRVVFRGALTPGELADAYKRCSMLVLPSTGEGFGIVYIEAGLFGRPSLAARAGGASEVVEDGVTGRLVDAGDAAGLTQALVSELGSRERLARLGTQARTRTLAHHGYDSFVRSLADHLAAAAAPARRSASSGARSTPAGPATRPTLGVVIPTYQRPAFLHKAHASLAGLAEPPDVICLVCRDTDAASLSVAKRLGTDSVVPTRVVTVTEPGHLPPVQAGTRALADEVDLVAILDDDAEADPGWAATARRIFGANPRLGGLAGQVRNYHDGVLVRFDPVDRASYVSALGRVVGDMYKPATFEEDRPAVVFMGGNCCLRSELWKRVEFDLRLNQHVAYNYELDLALQIENLGHPLRYAPDWSVKHHNAARAAPGGRGDSPVFLRHAAYNLTRIYLRRGRGLRKLHLLASELLLGTRLAPGLLAALPLACAERSAAALGRAGAAGAGRMAAFKDWYRERR